MTGSIAGPSSDKPRALQFSPSCASLILIHHATMGSIVLPHLRSAWHVDQAILSEEERLVVIRFGRDHDPDCEPVLPTIEWLHD